MTQFRLDPVLKHIHQQWLESDNVIYAVLVDENIDSIRLFKQMIADPNKVNSIKNKTGQTEEDLSDELKDKLRCTLSYMNQLQLNYGPVITVGVYDFKQKGTGDFEQFFNAAIPFVDYNETTAIELQAWREKHQLEVAALSVHSASSATSSATTNTGQSANSNPSANSNSNANSSFSHDQQSLATLQKAFKFDQSAFLPFKVERNWLAWKRSFTAQCRSFDMQDVLNASFVPVGGDATLLFDRRNLIMMTVLKAKICTVKGREIVNRHLDNGDGQKTFAELSTYYSGPGSIGRKQHLQELLNNLHTPLSGSLMGINLGDQVAKWETWYEDYHYVKGTLANNADKLSLLEAYLFHVAELENIGEAKSIIASFSQSPSAHVDQTLELYRTRVQEIDQRRKKKAIGNRKRIVNELTLFNNRSVCTHETELSSYVIDDDSFYHVYRSEMAQAEKRPMGGSRMPYSVWNDLTPAEKQAWDTISEETKKIILNCRHSGKVRPNRRAPPRRRPMPPRHDPNSQNRVPGAPIAATARINAAEQEPTPSPPLPTAPSDTNEHQAEVNITEMMSDLQAGLHDDDAHWRYEDNFLSDLANREVNQTSHHPTFAMPRFLSQDEESYGIGTAFERYGDDDGSAIREQDTSADGLDSANLVGNNDTATQEVNLIDLDDSNADISIGSNEYFASQVERYDGFDGYSVHNTEMVPSSGRRQYRVSASRAGMPAGMLDRGANGGVAGDNSSVRVICLIPNTFIDLQGIDHHTVSRVPIGTVGCVVNTQDGEIILIFGQYAILGRGRTIHSCLQLEAAGNRVSDVAIQFGGQQRLVTRRGRVIGLNIVNGLVYMNSRPFTDDEWRTLPHEDVTLDEPWVPRSHDHNVTNDPAWLRNQDEIPLPNELVFDESGEYIRRRSTEVLRTTAVPHLTMGSTRRPSALRTVMGNRNALCPSY